MLRRERWADLVDSETESNAESDAAAALPQPCEHSLPEADGQDWNTQPGQEGRCMPSLVLLVPTSEVCCKCAAAATAWCGCSVLCSRMHGRAVCAAFSCRTSSSGFRLILRSFEAMSLSLRRLCATASPRLAPCVSGSFSCNLNASGARHAVPGMLFLSGGSNFERAEVVLFVAVVEKAA